MGDEALKKESSSSPPGQGPFTCSSDSSSTTVATTQSPEVDSDEEPLLHQTLRPGDAVKEVETGFVGTVTSVCPPESAMVHFPGLEPDEQDMSVGQLLIVGRGDLSVGQRVTWRNSDEDVAMGAIGRLLNIREADRAIVQFPQGRFCFQLSELLAAGPAKGLQAGDRVAWTSSDDDLPSGTVGVVLGFKNYLSEAVVKFGERVFRFPPNQLLLKEPREPRPDDPSSSESDGEEEEEETPGAAVVRPPCYPFPGARSLRFSIGEVQVVVHDNFRENVAPVGVVVFCPGTHGGVGPCRSVGQEYCPDALFPTLAKMLEGDGIVSCRVSWSAMHPPMQEAIQGVARATLHSIARATAHGKSKRKLRVCLVGHSLGGAATLATASVLEGLFSELNAAGEGAEKGQRLVGLCTLAAQGSMSIDAVQKIKKPCVRKLFLHGTADTVLPCRIARHLFEVAHEPKELELLEGGEHDLFTFRAHLLDKISKFLRAALFGSTTNHRRSRKSGVRHENTDATPKPTGAATAGLGDPAPLS